MDWKGREEFANVKWRMKDEVHFVRVRGGLSGLSGLPSPCESLSS